MRTEWPRAGRLHPTGACPADRQLQIGTRSRPMQGPATGPRERALGLQEGREQPLQTRTTSGEGIRAAARRYAGCPSTLGRAGIRRGGRGAGVPARRRPSGHAEGRVGEPRPARRTHREGEGDRSEAGRTEPLRSLRPRGAPIPAGTAGPAARRAETQRPLPPQTARRPASRPQTARQPQTAQTARPQVPPRRTAP